MSFVTDMFGGGGDDAGDAAIQASRPAVKAQRNALRYLKQTERIPQRYREEALGDIRGAYSGTGEEQQQIIDRAISSPLYGAIMGGQEAGEEAILRNAAMTGGMRSGNVQSNLYDYNTQLENQALLQSYNQQMGGLQSLAGLPSLAPQIAQGISGIGTTLGQGQIAAAQAQQQGTQNMYSNIMGSAQLGVSAYGAGMFCDRRLKTKIKLIGEHNGFKMYKWDWNIVAQKMGLTGNTIGYLADEVYIKRPDAVSIKDMFMFIDYGKLNFFGKAA